MPTDVLRRRQAPKIVRPRLPQQELPGTHVTLSRPIPQQSGTGPIPGLSISKEESNRAVVALSRNVAASRASNYGTAGGPNPSSPMWKMLNVELILVVHLTASLITYMAVQDILLAKACRVDLKYSEKVCNALKSPEGGQSYADENQEVQKLMGSINMWRTILENFLPIILVCQIGAWSDKYGRKIPMLLVMLSFLAQSCIFLLSALSMEKFGALYVGLITSLIVSLAGNSACFGMAVFSYVSDVTPADKLTQRTSITGSCFFVGLTLGIVLSGQLARAALTFQQIFLVSIILETIGVVGLLILVNELPRDGDRVPTLTKLGDLLDLKHFQNAVCSVFKPRNGNSRKKLLLLLVCHSMILAPMYGESAVSYLFARSLYSMDASSYANFVTYKLIMGFIGSFVSMAVLTEFLDLSDPVIGIVSCLSQMGASLIFAFSSTVTLAYTAPVVALLSGSIMAVARSIMFKIIPSKDTGKVNSCMGSLESMTPLLVTPFYKSLYSATLNTFPGSYHILSAGFMLPPICIYIWFLLEDEDKKNNNNNTRSN